MGAAAKTAAPVIRSRLLIGLVTTTSLYSAHSPFRLLQTLQKLGKVFDAGRAYACMLLGKTQILSHCGLWGTETGAT
jgi:hypothetical protein